MAKTLEAFKQEFAAIKQDVKDSAQDMGNFDHNLDTHREHIVEGFKVLGLRLVELRHHGMTGTTIEAYMSDKELAVIVKELSNRRETAKADALKADALHKNTMRPMAGRITKLLDDLDSEIATRKGKKSSATLGLNQSWKEMEPLRTEVNTYKNSGDKDLEFVINFPGTYPASQFVNLYNSLMKETLTKDAGQMLSEQEQELLKQQLNDKVIKLNTGKVKGAATIITTQSKLAATAHKAKNIQALSAAKKASSTAMTTIKTILIPYDKAMKDAKLQEVLKKSPDGQAVLKGVAAIRTMRDHAESEDEDTQARRFA